MPCERAECCAEMSANASEASTYHLLRRIGSPCPFLLLQLRAERYPRSLVAILAPGKISRAVRAAKVGRRSAISRVPGHVPSLLASGRGHAGPDVGVGL